MPAAVPRSTVVELDAPAKVNLFLHVLDREADGYHGIVTLFQAIDLCDHLRVEVVSGGAVALAVTGLDAGPPQDNLVHRAAAAFLEESDTNAGVRVALEKRIPAGGGLGGGSSDAAATLRALDALLPGALSAARLRAIAARLGSDVPFFLGASALAIGEGRGERLTPLRALPAADVILALPESPVPTAWAYRALDEHRTLGQRAGAPSPTATDLGSWEAVARVARNDFEDVVPGAYPLVALAHAALAATRPAFVLLSGSGSSSFAVYRSAGDAHRALGSLPAVAGVRFLSARTLVALPMTARDEVVPAGPRG